MNQLRTATFFAILGELILGGGGRPIAFGPVSLRMVLFSIAMIITIVEFLRGKRMSQQLTIFLVLFVLSLVLALLIGILSGAQPKFWIEDIKPLSYILILPFFYFVLSDFKIVRPVPAMIVTGGMLLAFTFFSVLILIHSGVLPFLSFYDAVIGTGEFFFRAETTFFYKGFIYICIALIFSYLIPIKYRKSILIALGLAIVLTMTRGFIFALAMTWFFYALLERKYPHVIASVAIVIIAVFFSKPIIYQLSESLHWIKGLDEQVVPKDKLLGNRDESDAGRVDQLRQVFAQVTPVSFFLGHGFGIGVPSRPVHMEISYLEIFHKQGVTGLAIWAYLFYLLFRKFKDTEKNLYSKAYFYSASFLFFQSITNQFINNPIGLSFALLSLTWLHFASKEAEHPVNTRLQKGDEISITNF